MKRQQLKHLGGLEIVEVAGKHNRETIVLLHGFGADAYDLSPISSIRPEASWIFPQGPLLIPFSPGFTGRAWFPVDIELLSHAVRENRFDEISKAFPSEIEPARLAIEEMLSHLSVPRSKIILGGFSQGAVLALECALKFPEKCGGLLIFSGTLIHEQSWKKLAPLHKTTPFFQSHGRYDPLLPVQKAKDLENLLIENGWAGKLHIFEGGHAIPSTVLSQLASFLQHQFLPD